MEQVSVKIKPNGSNNLATKLNLLKLTERFSLKITKITDASDQSFLLHCLNSVEAEKIFSTDFQSALNAINFESVLPYELKSNRTVFIYNVDADTLSHNEDAIKREIEAHNNNQSVCEVIKIPRSRTLKIVFASSTMVRDCIETGIFMFYLHIPGYRIRRDKFIRILQCYVCYEVESHTSRNCPKKQDDPSYKICSNCSSTSHRYQSCPEQTNFKCVNCDGSHRTISMACPLKRDAVKIKRQQPTSNGNYSDAVKKSTPTNFAIDPTLISKSISITVLALLKNAENPGTFSTVINSLYQKNNMPTLNLDGFEPPKLST